MDKKRNDFYRRLANFTDRKLHCLDLETMQVNLGFLCNQECTHCHVFASPNRREVMEWSTMEKVIRTAKLLKVNRVDLTGGAPELNQYFRKLVTKLRKASHHVLVRTNLTVLHEPDMEDLPVFFRNHQIELVASLPCYLEKNVDDQRGIGVYVKSIEAIRKLNAAGYGTESNLPLNLVYNPAGQFLPPDQTNLEKDYRKELALRFDITFTKLLTMTNMPIGKFWLTLKKQNKEKEYMNLLNISFNPNTLERLMCRHQISINWEGSIYDCDFNLALKTPVDHGVYGHIDKLTESSLLEMKNRQIVNGNHCFGCTAGAGSSCGGVLC